MPGGLLNLISNGEEQAVLNGNPKKSFFKNTYKQYTNFGLQKFRIDYTGLRSLKMSEPSYYNFKIPRHADLLMDTYLSITLPDIWSPVKLGELEEYQFKWIPHIGCEIIEELEITSGGQTLQKFSGSYINLLAHRDFGNKKKTFDNMIGHVPELYDPANANGNNGCYPNARHNTAPSIRGTTLLVPIPAWFSLNSHQAFPLVALQYSELYINIKLRPVRELFTIQDASDNDVQPDFNNDSQQFYRFIQPPPPDGEAYENKRTDWNSDIHLISTYGFLSEDESRIFTQKPQSYLIRDIFETTFHDIANSNIVKTSSSSLTTSWMFFLRRSDAKNRNAWSNYTNWEYNKPPWTLQDGDDAVNTGIKYAPQEDIEKYRKEILSSLAIIIDGKYRENQFATGVYKHASNFYASQSATDDLPFVYNYNFCLNTSPQNTQPSGAINFSNFKNIELEITTHLPPKIKDATFTIECADGTIFAIDKNYNSIFQYTYDLLLFEERCNILTFINGLCGLKYMR